MGESQGNPFIGNPFMQKGRQPGKPAPSPECESQPLERESKPRHQDPEPSPLASPEQLRDPVAETPKKTAKSKIAKAAKSSKAGSKATAAKAHAGSKRKPTRQSSAAPPPPPTYSGNGYRVQVLAKIPMPSNPTMPSRDYLWFAVYPIIPRVGDCIFHDGRYFRVNAVFLYENTNAGWCADLEVSDYTRRH